MTEAEEQPSRQDAADQVGRELLAIHKDSYGYGAGKVSVEFLEDTVIVFLDELELQRSEDFLIENGKADIVLETRSLFQRHIETTFRAAVERATGREVVSFASVTQLDPNYSVEIFRLKPAET